MQPNLASQTELEDTADRLVASLTSIVRPVVAFSGGVDSAVVAKAAQLAGGKQALAITGISPAFASHERQIAADIAQRIGIRHLEVNTLEAQNPDYIRNESDRCFHCKTELYRVISDAAVAVDSDAVQQPPTVLSGANADDLADFRPGLVAAAEANVRHPLAELSLKKADVRALAKLWDLPVWDKPASPCLSSRIAYGQQVTPERLKMIEQAETFLRDLGFTELRVRYHQGDFARIEVPSDSLPRIAEFQIRQAIVAKLKALGFLYITLDIEGLRSGNLNQVISADELRKWDVQSSTQPVDNSNRSK